LRVDREGGIPPSNPLVNVELVPACGAEANCGNNGAQQVPDTQNMVAPRKEIYLWGFRNPWRFAFDSQTGFLWIGDVGEITFEEITLSKGPGEHHGWPWREGDQGQDRSRCSDSTPMSGACVEPLHQVDHAEQPGAGQGSITGGVFSSDCSWPEGWRGRYWFGEYSKNRIWTLTPNAARDGVEGGRTDIVRGAFNPVHFFNGLDGAIYYVGIEGGGIWKIAPEDPVECPRDPAPMCGNDAGLPGPADAGNGGADGGAIPSGDDDDGCGCTVPERHRAPVAGALLAIALVTALMYLRRPRR
jgi:hypothetical protein